MVLSDSAIIEAINNKEILISDFDLSRLGSNSYDVRLSDTLLIYKPKNSRIIIDISNSSTQLVSENPSHWILDSRESNPTYEIKIPEEGYKLQPGILYLGSTMEYTETHKHLPVLDGKSSIGRLGISIHCTAGKGDVNFCGYWTMEIFVIHPVRVYAGMKIGQLTYHEVKGEVMRPYNKKPDAKYRDQGPAPVASKMHENFVQPSNS